MEAAERRGLLGERFQVANQPHRRGDMDQLLENPLGRLIIRHKLRREYYDAGQEYGGLVRHFYHAHGIQLDFSEGRGGNGLGVRPGTAKWLAEELERIEPPLQKLNPLGFSALKTLCVHEREIAPEAEQVAIIVLCELGSLLRKVGRR